MKNIFAIPFILTMHRNSAFDISHALFLGVTKNLVAKLIEEEGFHYAEFKHRLEEIRRNVRMYVTADRADILTIELGTFGRRDQDATLCEEPNIRLRHPHRPMGLF